MTAMAVNAVPALQPVRLGRPAPWSFALVGALAVAVVAGGSVAVTQTVLGNRLDEIGAQVTQQAQRADNAEAQLTAVQGQLDSAAAVAARRAAGAQAEITALRAQLAAETARATQADSLILSRLTVRKP
jgi:hypothetical protein